MPWNIISVLIIHVKSHFFLVRLVEAVGLLVVEALCEGRCWSESSWAERFWINSQLNMNFMRSLGAELRLFMLSLVSVLNIFIFFIGVCVFPQGRHLTHYNLWFATSPGENKWGIRLLVQILRVTAEAIGRFSPHQTLFIMRDAVFSWAISEKCQQIPWTRARLQLILCC